MFEDRIKLLQNSLPQHEIDALFITSSYNIAYLTGIHAFSHEEREARMLITANNVYLLTDARYIQMLSSLTFLQVVELTSELPFAKQFLEICKTEKIRHLGFEEENISYKEAADLEEKLSIELTPTADIVEELRAVKDNEEVKSISKACALSDKAFEYIKKYLAPGVTELEVKANLENFIRLQGGELSFSSIVAFGKNSAIPHHMSDETKLSEKDIILLDFGAKVNGYASDMTRTVFLKEPSKDFLDMYRVTLEAQEVAYDYLKQHMNEDFSTKKIHEYATSHIKASGFPPIPHAIGHGAGLQVHELPTLSPYSEERLQPGMIITLEPGIYVPTIGGIRIEDTVLVTTAGYETLTKASKKLTVL